MNPVIWVVSSPQRLHGEAAYFHHLMDAGLDTLLLRKPGWTAPEYAALLQSIHYRHHERIMIAGQPELCARFGLMGLHMSESFREECSATALQEYRQRRWTLSTSIHMPVSPGDAWKYLLLGPVFDSISKPGYTGKWSNIHAVPPGTIAIGGVSEHNIPRVKAMGCCGAALLGAIWTHPEKAVQTYQTIKAAWYHT